MSRNHPLLQGDDTSPTFLERLVKMAVVRNGPVCPSPIVLYAISRA
jgi:hypothetical protein